MHYFDDTWAVLETYFKTNPYFLTGHHLDSWNDFVSNKVKNTIQVLNPFIVIKNQPDLVHEINIYIGGIHGDAIYINKPVLYEEGNVRPLLPNEARLRDLTYQCEVFADISVVIYTKEVDKEPVREELSPFEKIKIGAFPIMIHSKLCCLHNQPFEMLKEMGECPFDQGGYFIIDGKEKVIVAQERITLNKIFTSESKMDEYSHEALVRCTSEDNPLFPKTIKLYVNDINRNADKRKPNYRKAIPTSVIMTCPNVMTEVPIFVMFRALGVESDKQIIEYILGDLKDVVNEEAIEFLRGSVLAANDITTQRAALEYLKGFVKYQEQDKVLHVLTHDLFPNVGFSFHKKAMFLGHVVRKLVFTVLGVVEVSDRDSYIYKRVDISGFLIGNLFRDYYNQFRNNVRITVDKEYLLGPWRSTKKITNLINNSNLTHIFRSYIIEDGMKKSLKGSWGKTMIDTNQDTDSVKEGVVQDLSRISYLSYMSHIRRVNTPIDSSTKIVAPHRLHPSQYGVMCPIESPDGASIGLLKHFAILCNVTFDSGTSIIIRWMQKLNLIELDDIYPSSAFHLTKVMINSTWVGVVDHALQFYTALKMLKLNGYINKFVSVSWNIKESEINVNTEAGRCCRPLYVVKPGTSKLIVEEYIHMIKDMKITWDKLTDGQKPHDINPENVWDVFKNINNMNETLKQTCVPIEYIDVEEANASMIAMDYATLQSNVDIKYTHCEIHPSTMFGAVGGNLPMLNHNQAPRNIFFCAQSKQAVGAFAANFNKRIDTMSYVLSYPQRQLVTTRYKELMFNNMLTGGENLIVAICTWTGYNQEDSIIVNESAIQRGMFNMTYFKNIIEKENVNGIEQERIVFTNPLTAVQQGKQVQNIKYAKYKETLEDDGLPKLNKYIGENDAILGKMLVKTVLSDVSADASRDIFDTKVATDVLSDKSTIADKTISGIVDKVVVYNDITDTKTCKIRLRKTRIPELGDKMAAVHGQKGVVGLILPASDMPFSKDGITPDIIINPHAFPSRMTIGQLLECVLAKTAVLEGCMVDATPFNNTDYKSVYELLQTKYGMDMHGNEILYNGRTGDQIETEIFIGPTYYQRLKHMVADKLNYRLTGPRTMTTRQPTQGRGNNGGLRIGEMERDSILAHGLAGFLKESLMERSDKYSFDVENSTGQIAITNKSQRLFKPSFDDGTFYSSVCTPYAFKLLMQEVVSLGIKPILVTDKNRLDDVIHEEDEGYADCEILGDDIIEDE